MMVRDDKHGQRDCLVPGDGVLWLGGLAVNRKDARGRGGGWSFSPGAGAVATIYDMLNEDKRDAVEFIVEDRTIGEIGWVSALTASALGLNRFAVGGRSTF
jgi:hypothetical protein